MAVDTYTAPNGATVRIHAEALASIGPSELALRRRALSQAMRQCALCPNRDAPHNMIASAESAPSAPPTEAR